MSSYINTAGKRQQQQQQQQDIDDDGFLHFQSKDHYESLGTSNEEKAHYYTYIKPDEKATKKRALPQQDVEKNRQTRKGPFCSRRCLVLTVVVMSVCALAALGTAVYFIVKYVSEKNNCLCEIFAGENFKTTTLMSITTPPLQTENTTMDITTTTPFTTSTVSIESLCLENETSIIPDPQLCQAYYTCENNKTNFKECTYPDLFNTDTLSCDNFDTVVCGDRFEPKQCFDYIYLSGMCDAPGCRPCYVDYPSCEGKLDGRNVYENREWYPNYIICYKERFMGSSRCTKEIDGTQQLFNPIVNQCVSLYRVPRERGGLLPNCTGKDYGRYPNDYNLCNRYTICGGGELIDDIECPSGQGFDEDTNQCSSTPNTCACSAVLKCDTSIQ